MPFWPTQSDKKKKCVVRILDDGSFPATSDGASAERETQPFCFVEPHTTLLKLAGTYGGVNVECQVLESAIEIVCQQYTPGSACVQLVNHTAAATIEYCQRWVLEVVRCSTVVVYSIMV